MSFLSRLFRRSPQAAPDDPKDWGPGEWEIYFEANPSDPVWGPVTRQKARAIQGAFLALHHKCSLDNYRATNDLPKSVIDTICDVANRVGEPLDINPAHIILPVHLFVEADERLRVQYRTRWISVVVKREYFIPPPENLVDYVRTTYFSNG